MKSKRASVIIFSLMLAVVVIILAIALAPAAQQIISSAMNASESDTIGMDCDNESISNFTKAACVVTDFSLFWFFGAMIFLAGVIVTGRILFS